MDYTRLEAIINRLAGIAVAVIGDYCLDEYLIIDPAKDEPSLETGLTAYQVVRKEAAPGAAGTIAKNLAYLGVRHVYAVGFVGDDGRGLELSRGLTHRGIHVDHLIKTPERITPAYTKPWIMTNGTIQEMNRLDIKNWTVTPPELEEALIEQIKCVQDKADAVIMMDQLTERNCGVITDRVRAYLCETARENKQMIMYADSRRLISAFKNVIIKGNQFEIVRAVMGDEADATDPLTVERCCAEISRRSDKPLVMTMGERGTLIASDGKLTHVPAFAVHGQIDVCGAGDSFTSGFVSALAAGATLAEAGMVGNLAASVCITQLGSTGKVTPALMLERIR